MTNELALFAKMLEALIKSQSTDAKTIAKLWLDIIRREA